MDAVQILDKHFATHWKNRTCNICGNTNWNIVPDVFSMPSIGPGAAVGGGQTVPVLCAVCSQCGQMVLFNAVALGIVTPQQQTQPASGA